MFTCQQLENSFEFSSFFFCIIQFNLELFNAYLNTLKNNFNVILSKHQLTNKSIFLKAQLAYVELSIYEKLFKAKRKFNANVCKLDETDLAKIEILKENIENGSYENYKQFEKELLNILNNILVSSDLL